MANNKAIDRIGQLNKNKYGATMEVVEYNDANNILIKFVDYGNVVSTTWRMFIDGRTRNVYDKTVHGVGYIGEGEYIVSEERFYTKHYTAWNRMIERCYSDKFHKKNPTYKNCLVCNEWHNFQNFAAWYDDNFYQIGNEVMCLDKDILVKGNKIYSPDTCIYVPRIINSIFVKNDANRGNFPIGVYWNKKEKKYFARCNNFNGEATHLGAFNDPNEAFKVYKKAKEKVIKEFAEEYKDKVPNKLYKAMLEYKVDIND